MKRICIVLIMLLIIVCNCTAEELNAVWHSLLHNEEPPEIVYYPEFQLRIPENWELQYVKADGWIDFNIPYANPGYGPMAFITYVPYADLDYAVDCFDENTYMPGSYEFREHFAHSEFFGGDRIDCLYRIKSGERYGAAVGLSQNGEETDNYNVSACIITVPGEYGFLYAWTVIAPDDEEAEQAASAFCLELVGNLMFVGGEIEAEKHTCPPYIFGKSVEFCPDAPFEWRLTSDLEEENESGDEIYWEYEAENCFVEIRLLAADGLIRENVEFDVIAGNGVIKVCINGMRQASRILKGLENGETEYAMLDDGTEVLIYSAEYDTARGKRYSEGAMFVCEYGMAMPFVSSEQPIPESVLETAIGLYAK